MCLQRAARPQALATALARAGPCFTAYAELKACTVLLLLLRVHAFFALEKLQVAEDCKCILTIHSAMRRALSRVFTNARNSMKRRLEAVEDNSSAYTQQSETCVFVVGHICG